jgi:ADP-ribosyl-[dinitrogen reductase] hydrolase
MANPTKRERIEGGIWGLVVGDALGVPWEFHSPDEIPAEDEIEYAPPPGYDRAHGRVPPATWSDDGAQALCLLETLLEKGELDVDDLAQRFIRWHTQGYMTPDGRMFDVGKQTAEALYAIQGGKPVLEAAPGGEFSNGNGSLMRCLPLALWHRGSSTELVELAHLQSRVTHPHPRSQICCALYCLWAKRELAGDQTAWSSAVTDLRRVYRQSGQRDMSDELERRVEPDQPPGGKGSGYVVDCLYSARLACKMGDTFEQVVRQAIRLGKDTDTTACVAGGIAGVRFGVRGIPERWRNRLRGQYLLRPLVARLVKRVG